MNTIVLVLTRSSFSITSSCHLPECTWLTGTSSHLVDFQVCVCIKFLSSFSNPLLTWRSAHSHAPSALLLNHLIFSVNSWPITSHSVYSSFNHAPSKCAIWSSHSANIGNVMLSINDYIDSIFGLTISGFAIPHLTTCCTWIASLHIMPIITTVSPASHAVGLRIYYQ
ncbi:hypothetical protein P692DRAFT_20229179 [Suillus brevipes Sb2]|nr:hypothetical protein P692DRAFT_20229179 [Suillus brevipes Sb2]